MKSLWFSVLLFLRWWRKLLPHRLLLRAVLMLAGLGSNVQAQQQQVEQLYARLRYHTCCLREDSENEKDSIKTEELL